MRTGRTDKTGEKLTEQNTIKQTRGKKLIKWSKKAGTTTLNVHFKVTTVSLSSFTISWVYFLPWKGKLEAALRQEPLTPQPGVPALPTAPWVCPTEHSLQAEEGSGESSSVCFSTVCAYLYLWKHFRKSVGASGSCFVV